MKKNKSKNKRYKICKYAGTNGFKGCRTCCKKFKRNKKTYKKCIKHCMTTKFKPKKYKKVNFIKSRSRDKRRLIGGEPETKDWYTNDMYKDIHRESNTCWRASSDEIGGEEGCRICCNAFYPLDKVSPENNGGCRWNCEEGMKHKAKNDAIFNAHIEKLKLNKRGMGEVELNDAIKRQEEFNKRIEKYEDIRRGMQQELIDKANSR